MSGGAYEYMANSIEEGNEKTQLTGLRKYEPKFATIIYRGNKDDGYITDSNGIKSSDG